MKIRIKKNAYVWSDSGDLRKFLQENEGKFIDVETDFLFHNQYNTEKFRLFDSQIDCVVDDIRPEKSRCKYCGTMMEAGENCTKHPECAQYGMELFTPENTYFIKYPIGCNFPEERQLLSIDQNNIKIGTYDFEIYPSLGYYRLRNCRKTINFLFDRESKLFFVHNDIGYTQKRRLNVPADVQEKLINILMTR